MKQILRSIIECDDKLSHDQLIRNYLLVQNAVDAGQLEWVQTEDASIYQFVANYVRAQADVPSLTTTIDYFRKRHNEVVIVRLESLLEEQPYARTNFRHLLRTIQEDQIDFKALVLLDETSQIIKQGRKDPKTGELIKGFDQAQLHFLKEAQKLQIGDQTIIHSDIRREAEKVRQEYLKAEADKSSALGILTGMPEIDQSCGGVKRGELWIHAAFTGQLKTTFAINWGYNAITRFGKNVVYISLEMSLSQLRRQLYVLHSANYRFSQAGFKPLDVMHVQRGLLTPEEREFYFDHVINDFENNPTYGTFEIVHPDRPWNLNDIKRQVELLEKEMEVSMVVIDHGLLVEPTEQRKNSNYLVSMNSVVDDSKRLALTFNHNLGLPVVLLWQMSRTGWHEAAKNDGVYDLSALNWASACEKTADVVTATYHSKEMQQGGLTKFTHLKNRDNAMFEPFIAHVQFPCRKIMPQSAAYAIAGCAYQSNQLSNRLDNRDMPL